MVEPLETGSYGRKAGTITAKNCRDNPATLA